MTRDNGLASFQRRFRAVPQRVIEAINADMPKAGDEIAATIRALAPKMTGNLAASVEVTAPGQTTPAYSQPGGQMTVPDGAVAITAGNAEVRYAHLVEYGTAKAPAHPFFWPGYRLSQAAAVRLIRLALRRAVASK